MASAQERLAFALELLAKSDARERVAGASELVELAHAPELASALRPAVQGLLAEADPQLRAAGTRALAALGPSPELVGTLEKCLQDPEAVVRREAARALGGMDDVAARSGLVSALADGDAQVAFEAAVGLAGLGDDRGAEVLLAAVDDKVRRFFALGALARISEPRARAKALGVLHKRLFISDFERAQAAGLLTRLGDEAGRAYLLGRLQKKRADDRGLAMELCGEHKLTEAIPLLRAALADADELFRGTAARSLGLLRDADSEGALAAVARDAATDYEVRCDAMEGLMFLRTPGALEVLHGLSAADSNEIREAANDALDWIQQHPENAS